MDDPAVDHRRVHAAGVEQRRDHRGGRGLAVGAGDRDVRLQPHQLGEHLGAAHHRQVPRPRRVELGVARLDRRGDDDDARALEVLGVLADEDPRALLLQPLGDRARLGVRALHGEAVVQQHLGDARHADAADADEMDRPDVVRKARLSVHASTLPFSARRSTSAARCSVASGRPTPRLAAAIARAPSGSVRMAAMVPASRSGVSSSSRNHEGASGLDQPARVRRLVVVGGVRVGHQDRRAADRRDVGDRARAGAADDEARLGQPLGHVVEEAAQVRRHAEVLVGGAHPVHVLWPHLLAEPQPRAQARVEVPHRLGHDPAEEAGALAAADHHEAHRPVAGLDVGGVELREHRGPHRVADVQPARAVRQRGRPDAAGDHLDLRCEAAVDPAEHAVLLVDQPRDLQRPGGEHRRQRRVAAEARDQAGRSRRIATSVPAVPAAIAKGAAIRSTAEPWPKVAAGGGAPLDRRRKAAGVAGAAGVGGERHPPAAGEHLLGERLRREHVAAGAAGGDDEQRRAQRAPPRMSSMSCCGRLRVNASSTPRPSAAAISDEPP